MPENRNELSHLKKREIQAPVVTKIINGFIEEFGKEKTLKVLTKIIAKDAIASGCSLAEKYNNSTMNDLVKVIKEVWCEEGAMEINVLKENETEFHFDVLSCKYVDIYKELGMAELGKCLSCDRDLSFNDGFNPKIKLERSKTIMEGEDRCDFRYNLIE